MSTTLLTLATGRVLEVKGDYESINTYLKTRQLSADDGKREVTTSCGETLTIATSLVGIVERAQATTKRQIGFR